MYIGWRNLIFISIVGDALEQLHSHFIHILNPPSRVLQQHYFYLYVA